MLHDAQMVGVRCTAHYRRLLGDDADHILRGLLAAHTLFEIRERFDKKEGRDYW
jgi:hypothetical protein